MSQFVVVANRLPVKWVPSEQRWESSPGGLVSALAPVLEDVDNSVWVGWTGATGDAPDPFTVDGIDVVPVGLSRADVQLYYEGMSNATLWPLYHDAVQPPEYHRTWWNAYRAINERFCDATAEAAEHGALVWVHDYQLQLVPGMLRARRPDLRIGWFNHIPFPPLELFVQLPWRRAIVDGLLGADVVGFQTRIGAQNLMRIAERLRAASPILGGLDVDGRQVTVDAFPIGIDVERFASAAVDPATIQRAKEIRNRIDARCLLLGVDRLDYTKGIDLRMRAFGELLDEGRLTVKDAALLQIAQPSRSNIPGYVELRERVERIVGEINGAHAEMGRPVIHYLYQGQPFDELVAMYRAADVLLVTPFRDGMNLVSKEYVAAQAEDHGAVVLSEFTGSANELSDALLVNPHDIEGVKSAIEAAVTMDDDERRRRMRNLRAAVAANDVRNWAQRFVSTLRGE